MSPKFLLLAALLASGCVAAETTSSDARLVKVMVTSQGKHSFEKLVTAAQPLANQACAQIGRAHV